MGASERDEWQRLVWQAELSKVDARRLVFVDECGTNTSLAPLYAYAPKGHRAHLKIPRNRGANITPLSSISVKGMGPSMVVVGAATREVFEAYVEYFLCPDLKGKRVCELIEERDCELLYLHPYSPDLNSIEVAFSKIKRLLRQIGARTREILVAAMGKALDTVTARDAWGFFAHSGHHILSQ